MMKAILWISPMSPESPKIAAKASLRDETACVGGRALSQGIRRATSQVILHINGNVFD